MGAVITDGRSTATVTEARPRTAPVPLPPQATTVSTGWSEATLATSKRRRYSTLACAGSTT